MRRRIGPALHLGFFAGLFLLPQLGCGLVNRTPTWLPNEMRTFWRMAALFGRRETAWSEHRVEARFAGISSWVELDLRSYDPERIYGYENRVARVLAMTGGRAEGNRVVRAEVAEFLMRKHRELFPTAPEMRQVRVLGVTWKVGEAGWMADAPGRWQRWPLQTIPRSQVRLVGVYPPDEELRAQEEWMKLGGAETDAAFTSRMKGAEGVVRLALSPSAPVTSGGLAELWNLGERVEGLTLGGRTLTQADLQGLGQLTHVTELSLSGGKFQAVEGAPTLLEALGGLRRLRVLRLQGLPVGDAIAGVVVQMPGLEELDLSRCEVSGAVLGELSQIKTLKVLSLTGAKGLGLALRQGVPPNRTLKSLDLSGTGLAGSDFMGLSRFRTLDHLVLDGCQLDDERLLALVRILKLTSISLNGTQVTEAGIKRLEKTSLRQVRWRGKWSEVREVGKGKP